MSDACAPRYEGYIFDLDGTVYRGEVLIPGAQENVAWLRSHGRRGVFLANKPLEPRSAYAAKLTRLGIPAPDEDVINSTQALMRYLRKHCPGSRLYVIGELAIGQRDVQIQAYQYRGVLNIKIAQRVHRQLAAASWVAMYRRRSTRRLE